MTAHAPDRARKSKSKGPRGRPLEAGDAIACAHTALKPLLVEPLTTGGLVRVIHIECQNCHAQPRAMNELVMRPPAIEGQAVDVELEAAMRVHGVIGGVAVVLRRRYDRQLEKDFLTGGFPEGADPTLPVIDIEPL